MIFFGKPVPTFPDHAPGYACDFRRFIGWMTAVAVAGVALVAGLVAAVLAVLAVLEEGAHAPFPFSLRRSCQGSMTLSQNSRVPMMVIAMLKGITKYSTRNTSSVASNCSRPNCGSATSIAASNT